MKKSGLVRFAGIVCALALSQGLQGEMFRFQYHVGDTSRILTTVREQVFVNNKLDHNAEILNRISVEITGINGDWGVHRAVFMTSESSTSVGETRNFVYGEEYVSVFERNFLGQYRISDAYFMPVVRNVPVFPERDLSEGDVWTAEGEEAYDLRRTFNIAVPYKVPFTANYRYAGVTAEGDKKLHIITVEYESRFASPSRAAPGISQAEVVTGTNVFIKQTIYFDNDRGAIDHYTEDFTVVMETARHNIYRFEGVSYGETTEYVSVAAQRADEVRRQVEDLNLGNVDVVADSRGLTLRIEDIQFLPDSAVLLYSEKEKIRRLAETVLSSFPENDLLITGHTALAGTAGGQKRLSEERARAVADELLNLGAADEYHMYIQGFGAEKPIAPNTTEAGRAKNRRVEITILNN